MTSHILRTLFVFGLLCMVPLLASEAFAVGDQPPGQPPYGLGVQGNATGLKLDGILSIDFTNYNPGTQLAGPAIVALRTRQGSNLHLFVASLGGSNTFDLSNLAGVEQTIIAGLQSQITNFYGGSTVALKAVDELKTLVSGGSFFVIVDVTLAVQ